jgi:predicted amidohydrolase
VCYDLRFPKWLRNENPPAYDLLLVCANWPGSRHEAWSTLLKARAIENLCYVVGVNRVGTDGVGIPYTGNSVAINYKGQEMSSCSPQCPQVQLATLDREPLDIFRQHWPFYLDND